MDLLTTSAAKQANITPATFGSHWLTSVTSQNKGLMATRKISTCIKRETIHPAQPELKVVGGAVA